VTCKRNIAGLSLVAAALCFGGCATNTLSTLEAGYLGSAAKSSIPTEIADPFEASNRAVFEQNQKFYKAAVYPTAKAYGGATGAPLRQRIEAFAGNASEPATFANNVLQLRPAAAATTLARFAINTTVGLGGLFDVAADQNLARQTGDLGQTFYVWGARDSQYLVLPIIGPTTVRDALGSGLEMAAQVPLGLILPQRAASIVGGIGSVGGPLTGLSRVEELQALEDSSLDFYVALRSIVGQKRQAELDQALAGSLLGGAAGPMAVEAR
jgi:phospholipid-binding lipoprotein MlaA